MTTQNEMADRVYEDEPIQWHLRSSKHDRCPRCSADLGYVKMRERMCMGFVDCGVWTTTMRAAEFVALKRDGGRVVYGAEGIEVVGADESVDLDESRRQRRKPDGLCSTECGCLYLKHGDVLFAVSACDREVDDDCYRFREMEGGTPRQGQDAELTPVTEARARRVFAELGSLVSDGYRARDIRSALSRLGAS